MTPAEHWTVLISGIGLIFVVLSTGVGLIVRITMRWSGVEARLGSIADKMDMLLGNVNQRIDNVDNRMTRHEAWHDEHPYYTRPRSHAPD